MYLKPLGVGTFTTRFHSMGSLALCELLAYAALLGFQPANVFTGPFISRTNRKLYCNYSLLPYSIDIRAAMAEVEKNTLAHSKTHFANPSSFSFPIDILFSVDFELIFIEMTIYQSPFYFIYTFLITIASEYLT